jgi:hypothetical protein
VLSDMFISLALTRYSKSIALTTHMIPPISQNRQATYMQTINTIRNTYILTKIT